MPQPTSNQYPAFSSPGWGHQPGHGTVPGLEGERCLWFLYGILLVLVLEGYYHSVSVRVLGRGKKYEF